MRSFISTTEISFCLSVPCSSKVCRLLRLRVRHSQKDMSIKNIAHMIVADVTVADSHTPRFSPMIANSIIIK